MNSRPANTTKTSQFARKCIFCEINNANSREHFYSGWMHDLLPIGPEGKYSGDIIHQHPKTGIVSFHKRHTKPGELYTKKMKVVCQRCNNVWMSALETVAKPILTPLITGKPIILGAQELKILAQWTTLKTLVCEHDTPLTMVTPQQDRTAFMRSLTIPEYFSVYALSHSSVSRIGYVRTTHTFSRTLDGPIPPLDGRQKNAQQVSVILGSTVLHVTAVRLDGFKIDDWLHTPEIIARRIWPPNVTPLSWPSNPILTDERMRSLAYSIEELSKHPNVKWGGPLPSGA